MFHMLPTGSMRIVILIVSSLSLQLFDFEILQLQNIIS